VIDWDTYFRFELLHRRFAPVDFRRWKRASQRALRALFPGPGVRVLDATAGLGDHTVNLAELGFSTEATDASPVAREATRRALAAAELDVPVHEARWESLGTNLGRRFDLIFNDAIHWTEDEATMHAALVGAREALVPGGALVFFFADARMPEPDAGLSVLSWDKEHLARHELAWSHPDGEAEVTHLVVREHAPRHIDEHHLYVTRTNAAKSLSSLVMRRIYAWDWHAMVGAAKRAGFADVTSHLFQNDHGATVAMNLARVSAA
jgi:SAM-dependent methyltransferase